MDLSKQVPLILTTSKILTSPTDSGIFKKRKLSECSEVSNSNSDRSSLNERFLELSLENNSKPQIQDDMVKIEESMPNLRTINIPKPMRISQEGPMEPPIKNDKFFSDLIKMSQNDVSGISQYLHLDIGSKMQTWEKTTNNAGGNKLSTTNFFLKSFMNPAFGAPFLRPDLLFGPRHHPSDSQGSGSTQGDNDIFGQRFAYKEKYIGNLTQEQREEKLNKYKEKKKNRKTNIIRYNVRKDLADKRERVQGRFVKTQKMFSHSDLMMKEKEAKMAVENIIKNNSDITVNGLSLSSSLGKRPGGLDLFDDSETSM